MSQHPRQPEVAPAGGPVSRWRHSDESAGLLNPFTPEDRDLIQRRIRGQLMAAARQSGILEHADQSAAKVLSELLSRDGYTVEIRRPIVVSQPSG